MKKRIVLQNITRIQKKGLILFVSMLLLPFTVEAQKSLCPDANHPHAIDLGMPSGTKWACCNVGAVKPDDYGGYYAWGETSTKSDYSEKTYRWIANGDESVIIKYNTERDYSLGRIDGRSRLEPSDDAAHANWGGNWSMPTSREIEEILNYTTHTWVTVGNVKGQLFTSKINGRSVFLPAAGLCTYNWNGRQEGTNGYYWSASLLQDTPIMAEGLDFTQMNALFNDTHRRVVGQSVRAVIRKNGQR